MSVRHVVVMGVAGSGKTTIAEGLAQRLGWAFAEGDSFHPPENVAKMSEGTPLTDADRWGWLESLAAWVAEHEAAGRRTVMSCSALRRTYRDVLRRGGPDMAFVHLAGDKGLLLERMGTREHFMPPTLLESQLDTLEPLADDEAGVRLDVAEEPERIVEDACRRLGLG